MLRRKRDAEEYKTERCEEISEKHFFTPFYAYFQNYYSLNGAAEKAQEGGNFARRQKNRAAREGTALFFVSVRSFRVILPGHTEDDVRQEEADFRDVGRDDEDRHPAEEHEGERRLHYLVDRRPSHSSA